MADEAINERTKAYIGLLGFKTYAQYQDFVARAVSGCDKFGDEFMRGLAHALTYANHDRSYRLLRAFFTEFEALANQYRIYTANLEVANAD